MFQSCIYKGKVFHRRVTPRSHVLRYHVFSLLIDLQELPLLDSKLRFFSHNKFNLLSVHDTDFGEKQSESLITYVQRLLARNGIMKPARILLSCYPRVLGYGFNPLSLFYCFDEYGELKAVVHEVHNTFGERHAYVLPVQDTTENVESGSVNWVHQTSDKQLFVSPFAHMNMRYEFRLNDPDARQVVVIRVYDETSGNPDLVLVASYTAQRETLSDRKLLLRFFSVPLMSFKVTAGIHWEALLLWLKRVPWFTHRPKEKSIQ